MERKVNQEPSMVVRLELAPETERILRERAAQKGQTLEALLEEIAVREAQANEAKLANLRACQ
jgi:hypothetical protein